MAVYDKSKVNVDKDALETFARHCQTRITDLNEALETLQRNFDNLKESWRDTDYDRLGAIIDALRSAVARGKEVITEDLLPFVSSKLAILNEQ